MGTISWDVSCHWTPWYYHVTLVHGTVQRESDTPRWECSVWLFQSHILAEQLQHDWSRSFKAFHLAGRTHRYMQWNPSFPYGYSFYYNVLIDSLLVLGPLVADPLHMPWSDCLCTLIKPTDQSSTCNAHKTNRSIVDMQHHTTPVPVHSFIVLLPKL